MKGWLICAHTSHTIRYFLHQIDSTDLAKLIKQLIAWMMKMAISYVRTRVLLSVMMRFCVPSEISSPFVSSHYTSFDIRIAEDVVLSFAMTTMS